MEPKRLKSLFRAKRREERRNFPAALILLFLASLWLRSLQTTSSSADHNHNLRREDRKAPKGRASTCRARAAEQTGPVVTLVAVCASSSGTGSWRA